MAGAINWGELRQQMLLSTHRIECCRVIYWDKQAERFNENMAQMDELTQNQIKRLTLLPEYTVLDVGAGTGRITIPVAKRVKHVTALEPSWKMLAILKAQAEKERLSNVQYVNRSLEEFDTCAGLVSYDVVIASFSLFMADIEKALIKMDGVARKSVHLFLSASKWINEELQKLIYDKLVPVYSDHIYVYNILHDLGIFANVEIWDIVSKENFNSLDDALQKFVDTYHIPQKKEPKLREYLRNNLTEDNGKLCLKRKRKSAMIWWTKNE